MDRAVLNYNHDEENFGFGEPAATPNSNATPAERLAFALIAIGLLVLGLQWGAGMLLGTWAGILGAFAPLLGGTTWLFWLRLKDTPPGIKHDAVFFRDVTSRGLIAWGLGILITGFYIVLYFYDDLRFDHGMPLVLERPTRMLDPLSQLLAGKAANRWFLYGFLYTAAILVFGFRMFMKYRGNRYQQVRTASVMIAQLGFAFLLPNLLMLFQQPEFYFSYFWPLKYDYLFPSTVEYLSDSGRLGVFMVFWGAAMSFLATPILTFFFGKRWYCSWVCGCGGLAETLGDPWRQLSSKSALAWKIERALIYSVLGFIGLTTALVWINSYQQGGLWGEWSFAFAKGYGFFIGAIFSGVIGVGFYPILGSRVWCRFGCPMAAVLGILQRTWSRFRITTNGDQCMSCGNCSTYCEMGIDVRAYAEKGENIVRASCVGCGVCSAVCPRGVLNLENGMSSKDRFDGADEGPIKVLIDSIKNGTQYPERETMFHREGKGEASDS